LGYLAFALLQAYENEGLNEATAGILPAMTLGDKTGVGPETRAHFAASDCRI
jgi:hypothetical protein